MSGAVRILEGYRARTLVAFALILLAALSFGQNGTYRLKPLDIIRIQIWNEAQVNSILPIGEDGNVSAPFVGIVRAQGRTTSELEAELAQLYQAKLRLRDPKVSVTIEQFRPVRATVGGMVRGPGVYEMRPGDTLLMLLTRGGGPDPDRADLRRATLRRAGSPEVIPIDLHALIFKGDMSQNYSIEDGDEMIVPEETRSRILVMGAITSPGPYPYKEPLYLYDAITMARGPIRNRSKLSSVMVLREDPTSPGQYVRLKADIVRFITKGDNSQNVQLKPGDIVYVNSTNTPDLAEISAVINSAFVFDRFFRDGLFGLFK